MNENIECPHCKAATGWAFHAKGEPFDDSDAMGVQGVELDDSLEGEYIELGVVLCFNCMRILSVAGLDYIDSDVKYNALREAAKFKFLASGQHRPE